MHIAVCVSTVIAIFTFYLVMRYNLHMFQLNGYKNNEQISWIGKNSKKQLLLALSGITGAGLFFVNSIVPVIIYCLVNVAIIRYYWYLKKSNVKKKLVFTNRVKRIIVTDIIINLLIVALVFFLFGFDYFAAAFALLIPLQPLMIMLVNIINKPIEKSINNHYLNDAKKKLKGMPDLKIIGITGSYGKTSVKFYLKTLLQEKYNVLATPGNFNTTMGVVRTIREYMKSTDEVFLCEMGARYVNDIKEICDFVHPQYGIITSVGPQHLETFGSIGNIVKTKFELADALPKDGTLFLNGDNSYITENGKKYNNAVYYRNRSQGFGYRAENIELSQLGTEFTVISPSGEKERFQTRLIGEHNVINVIGAIAVANTLGIALDELKVPVRKIQPVEHRMQMIERGNVTIIDDAYNSNPVGSKAAVETLAMFDGVRILITPGMVELGRDEDEFNYKFGTYAAECCDYILLVGEKHTAPIRNGVIASGFDEEKCRVFEALDDAVKYAYSLREKEHKYILLENDLPDNY